MKERPILFSSAMVNAILSGRKTQTRRIFKCDLSSWMGDTEDAWTDKDISIQTGDGHSGFGCYVSSVDMPEEGSEFFSSPYGKPGDQLWVKETWGTGADGQIYFRADGEDQKELLVDRNLRGKIWRPSIHMPKLAARIILEVQSVRVERLQDISEMDAVAEGVTIDSLETWKIVKDTSSTRSMFGEFWESINGEDSWNQNPWLWVVEFKVVKS